MKIWTILFSFSILINTHSTAFAQKENVDLDDILQEDDVTSDEPDTLDLGGPEEQNPENVNPEDQVEPSFQATEPTPPEPTPIDLDEDSQKAMDNEMDKTKDPVDEMLEQENDEPVADDLLNLPKTKPTQKSAGKEAPPMDEDSVPDDVVDDPLFQPEYQTPVAEPDLPPSQGPPREAPFVDEEEDQNYLSDSIEEADQLASEPIFIKLPFEESEDEMRKRYNSDSYYKDLKRVTTQGKHEYDVETSEITQGFSIRFGQMTPPTLNRDFTFEDIYGEENQSPILFDYEYILTQGAGRISLKAGTGVFSATGNGRFEDGEEAMEEYTLYVFPTNLSAVYKFEYSYDQVLVPYVEGGVDGFGILETRDDGADPGYTVAPALHAAGGIQLLLDGLDPASIRAIDRNFGINHIWLVFEFRQYIGLDADVDFTGTLISGAVAFDM